MADADPSSPPRLPPPEPGERVAIFANPYSGARSNRPIVERLGNALAARGMAPVPIWSLDELAERVGENASDGWRCIVAAGGDGTLSVVVNRRPRAPIMMFPLGTENLFAKQFGYSRNVEKMADAIARGGLRSVDLGEADGHRFTCVTSAGFDGEVIHRLATWRHEHPGATRRVRRLSYVRHILAALLRYPYPPIHVDADGTELTGALVMAFNIPRYGLWLNPCPGGDPTDGLLDYAVFRRPGRVTIVGYGIMAMARLHQRLPSVTLGRAKRVTLSHEDDRPIPVEIDGEASGFTPRTITTAARAITIIDMNSG